MARRLSFGGMNNESRITRRSSLRCTTKAFAKNYSARKFIEGLEKRRDVLETRSQKSSLVQLTISLLLAVALISPDMSVSLFGLSAKAGGFREILLLVMGSMQVYGMLPAIEQARISDVMHLYLQKQAAGDPTVLRLLKLRHGMGTEWRMPELTGRTLSKWQMFNLVFSGIGLFLWVIAVFVGFVSLELFGMVSILRSPTISTGVSILLCIYLVVVTVCNFGVRALAGIGTNAKSPDQPAS
jgi:hypothetical protein